MDEAIAELAAGRRAAADARDVRARRGGRAPVRGAARRAQRAASATTRSSPSTATSPARSSCARCRCTSRSAARERSLNVYNALRGHLPELAALAANAPFHAGRDTGLASVRPLIGTLLPRQGVPPAFPSWEAFGEGLAWGGAGTIPGSGGGSCART